MAKPLKSAIIDLLGPWDVFPTDATDGARIVRLLEQLHPRASGRPLLRLGPAGDGGYLVPDDFEGIEACFSPGVGLICGFEKDCADRGLDVYLADRSVAHPGLPHERFHFERKYLGVTTDDDFMTLDDWVSRAPLRADSDLMLQIDIEGFEYEVLLGASDRLMRRFRMIVAEFHLLDQFWNEAFFGLAARAFEKILQTHACVHIHPNNSSALLKKRGLAIPPLAEFTFLRRDRAIGPGYAAEFPHPLDGDNTTRAHIALPPCMWRQR
ncbi:MAG: FkbM family methyltransferase [Gammaproteobacteria bacterium]|nr:FkbM family methyltransferase [Gammaproteobacteria bacterium]